MYCRIYSKTEDKMEVVKNNEGYVPDLALVKITDSAGKGVAKIVDRNKVDDAQMSAMSSPSLSKSYNALSRGGVWDWDGLQLAKILDRMEASGRGETPNAKVIQQAIDAVRHHEDKPAPRNDHKGLAAHA